MDLIIPLCSDGVGRSGAFCALMVSINRFKAEQMVDVFRTIITMRTQRPGLVANAVSCNTLILCTCNGLYLFHITGTI